MGEDFGDEEDGTSAIEAGGEGDLNDAEASFPSCGILPREDFTPEDMDALLEHSFLMTVTNQGGSSATSKVTFPIETQKLYEQYMKSHGVQGAKP